jgi:hypothetical protein
MTLVANFATSNADIVDNIGKFATGVNDTVGKFTASVNYTGGKYWEHYHTADTLTSELEGKNFFFFKFNILFQFSHFIYYKNFQFTYYVKTRKNLSKC